MKRGARARGNLGVLQYSRRIVPALNVAGEYPNWFYSPMSTVVCLVLNRSEEQDTSIKPLGPGPDPIECCAGDSGTEKDFVHRIEKPPGALRINRNVMVEFARRFQGIMLSFWNWIF